MAKMMVKFEMYLERLKIYENLSLDTEFSDRCSHE